LCVIISASGYKYDYRKKLLIKKVTDLMFGLLLPFKLHLMLSKTVFQFMGGCFRQPIDISSKETKREVKRSRKIRKRKKKIFLKSVKNDKKQ